MLHHPPPNRRNLGVGVLIISGETTRGDGAPGFDPYSYRVPPPTVYQSMVYRKQCLQVSPNRFFVLRMAASKSKKSMLYAERSGLSFLRQSGSLHIFASGNGVTRAWSV